MIKLENIQKVFRTEEVETVALGGVSLEVKKGEFVAIMGPSGCGKSTLLNILGLLDNPTSGTYLLDGENVGQLKESQRTKVRKGQIGFVFQSFNLIDELNVEENVELPLTYLKGAQDEGRRGAAPYGYLASFPSLSSAALWRSAATRRHCPCRRDEPQADPGR